MPKRFCNDDMVWILLTCKGQTWKFIGRGRLPGKRIVACSASKVTTRSLVYQSCQVVINSMLCQQGDTTLIIYQSCQAIVKQDDSHYMINLAPVLSENMTVTFMDITDCSCRIDRGIRNTSRQISFEFLFIKTRPPDKLHTGFRRGIEWRNQIRYVICQGGEFW